MNDLSGKIALIVGGGSGLGRATAALFLERGAEVVIAGRTEAKLAAAAQGFGAGKPARILPLDMTREEEVEAAMAGLADPGIDYLIVTAATVAHGPFPELAIDEARAMFDSKFWGPYRLAKAAVPIMREGGAIVLFSGVLSRRPGINCAALGAVNAAVEALARGLALELGPRIRANCVSPGMVRTEAHDRVPEDRRRIMFEKTGSSLPVGRIGRPEEIAEAAVLAATNGYLTGHVIDIDGGHLVRQYATR